MRRHHQLGGPLLLIALLTPVYSQQPTSWRDPSPHTIQFVTVDKNVRLEVLDWGGSGRPLVLLAGGGNTAHVFDDFAPKLTAFGHIYSESSWRSAKGRRNGTIRRFEYQRSHF